MITGTLRHQFCHATTHVVDGVLASIVPEQIRGIMLVTIEGVSFAKNLRRRRRRRKTRAILLKMFGHRALWSDGSKAVAFHPPAERHCSRREVHHLDVGSNQREKSCVIPPEKLGGSFPQSKWWSAAERFILRR